MHKKAETVAVSGNKNSDVSPSERTRTKIRDRRRGPRRSLLTSRLTRNIFFSNIIGLMILVFGALAMNRFESGLIEAKVDNLRSLAATITTVISEQATGYGGAAELDLEGARQVLRGVNVPEGWRVRLHDDAGQVALDTEALDDTISMSTLDPIITEQPDPRWQDVWQERVRSWMSKAAFNLPWRKHRRDAWRRDLKLDVDKALAGEPAEGPRYDADDNLIVTVSLPVKRVQQVLGVVTVESNDVASIVSAERRALAPIITLAFIATLLSSMALTLFITLPMRHLARAAEIVTRSSEKRDAIPDLSSRRDEIGDLSTVMREMTQGLYTRIDDIADFAADVAHEIKNPLTSLRSASDTLRVAKTDEQRAKLIDIIQQDVGRMDRLISDISKASKVDANLARETAQTLDVSEIIRNITEFYSQTRSGEGPSVVNYSKLPDDDPVFIRAFETPFAQVLRNLIDNALTFSPPTGIVGIGAKTTDGRVFIIVEDQGPGIPEGNEETVFDRFYTQRPKGAQFGSHSGLGLAICRQIITAHKGLIYAENRISDEGKVVGARFVVNVPRQTRGGGPSAPKNTAKKAKRFGRSKR
ncbi:stimulus-sensing domain-containing protein [Litorimonas sp. RW-G-Af-16]|uniref:stimulus-sensing domain-containing protein n=1 Tax=Litorimonas sp. RW-G-Af-16 TaxID=3241168 RepID=UPI00390C9B88